MAKSKTILVEVVQFVPVITFAISFLIDGGVDLERAATLFVISAIAAVIITTVLLAKRVLLNPILLGTNIWLASGAIAFGVPIPEIASILARVQASGLFAAVLSVGILLFFFRPATGAIGVSGLDREKTKRLSLMVLAATVGMLVWSQLFIDNIRLSGGLPFIVLNVTRRVLIRRGTRGGAAGRR